MAMNQLISRVLKPGFLLLVKVLVRLLLGLRIQHPERLPRAGPAILVANHNSHLDTLVLLSLFPLATAANLRPVANQHYFLEQNRCLAWFSRHVLNIIPVAASPPSHSREEECNHRDFLHQCAEALAQNQILLLYPEGTRGEPEHLTEFKSGIAHLAKRHPTVPIIPIFLQGLGKVLPKGECLLVPFICRIAIGLPLFWTGKKHDFLNQLANQMQSLSRETAVIQ
jgi:1-acyl-sn-glycerol-3-phosphate acyltransferase